MITTIQVKRETVDLLQLFRQRFHTKSYDETINALIEEAQGKQKSMFGILGNKGKSKMQEGLRDEDRM